MKKTEVINRDSEIKKLLEQFPNLTVNPIAYRKDEFELCCTKCKGCLVIVQSTKEVSDLKFNPIRGFYAGKHEITDGVEKVRCGCGTEYPIEEWEPY